MRILIFLAVVGAFVAWAPRGAGGDVDVAAAFRAADAEIRAARGQVALPAAIPAITAVRQAGAGIRIVGASPAARPAPVPAAGELLAEAGTGRIGDWSSRDNGWQYGWRPAVSDDFYRMH